MSGPPSTPSVSTSKDPPPTATPSDDQRNHPSANPSPREIRAAARAARPEPPTPLQQKLADPSLNIIPEPTLEAIANYIKSNNVSRIIVLTGAGISTASGIPDFRSPGTGLYANLQKYALPYPEAIFDMKYFRRNPEAFYTLARELFPGEFAPAVSHHFIRLLQDKKVLLRNYTQNIDTLERVAGVDPDLIVEAHGSFAAAHCVGRMVPGPHARSPTRSPPPPSSSSSSSAPPPHDASSSSSDSEEDDGMIVDEGCGKPFTQSHIRSIISRDEIPRCDVCKGLVKPDIVFFGQQLPPRFHDLVPVDFRSCDLAIVMGTSLSVAPFNSLVDRVPGKVPRLLVNNEMAGLAAPGRNSSFDFTGEVHRWRRDAVHLGACDRACETLADLLGWSEDLDSLVRDAARKEQDGGKRKEGEGRSAEEVAIAVGESLEADRMVPHHHHPSGDVAPGTKEEEEVVEEAKAVDPLDELVEGVQKLNTDA
ncbi:NAD-dependent protein deacetylase sirtuin-2 [Thoreauomyces humboldtii]|nr:NAD-dependent protein deacetylase sirtuin-2 [Thoreauomyces humboldtii]